MPAFTCPHRLTVVPEADFTAGPGVCRPCWVAARKKAGLPLGTRPGGTRTATIPSLPPCPLEGDVVVHANCGEHAHTRQCLHDDADWDLCVRGPSRVRDGGGVQHCQTCPVRPRAILLTGGIGDAIAVEGLLPPEARRQLTAVYYACPAAEAVRGLWQTLPGYPALKEHVILPTGGTTYYTLAAVRQAGLALPGHVEDWSIRAAFPAGRPYQGSSLLAAKLADPPAIDGPYVVIVPHSTWGGWAGRSFDAGDWGEVLSFLDARGMYGAVLGDAGMPDLPPHRRLVDLTGRTTMAGAVEVVKGAEGYIGIDSWASVLAPKLWPDSRICVKTVNSHARENAFSYFAPRQAFPFLKDRIEVPTWDGPPAPSPGAPESPMKVAIDIDGTIGRFPSEFTRLMGALKAGGHSVCVLTGAGTEPQREAALARLGMRRGSHYDLLVVVNGSNLDELGRAKAEWMRGWGADAFVDDHQGYCEAARAALPNLMILKVFP